MSAAQHAAVCPRFADPQRPDTAFFSFLSAKDAQEPLGIGDRLARLFGLQAHCRSIAVGSSCYVAPNLNGFSRLVTPNDWVCKLVAGLVAGSFSIIPIPPNWVVWHEESFSGGSMSCSKSCWRGLLGSGPQEQHPSEVFAVQVASVKHGQMVMGALHGIAWAHICHSVNMIEQNMFGLSMSNRNPVIQILFFFLGGKCFFCLVGAGFTGRMPAKYATIKRARALTRTSCILTKSLFRKEGQTKTCSECGASMVHEDISQLCTFILYSFSWHLCVFRPGKTTLMSYSS